MIPLRDENPTRITPWVTWLLVAVNVIVYFNEVTGGLIQTRTGLGGPMAGWTLVPAELTTGRDLAINGLTLQPVWLTLFTSMFLHGSLMHLLGNMLYLIVFGNNIEDALGHVKYLLFYLTCGLCAAGLQIVYNPLSPIPNLGASGAIAGVLGAYLLLFPHARVRSLVPILFIFTLMNVPAYLVLGVWIISQFFSQWTQSLMTPPGMEPAGGVAYLAHIGGFIAGMLLIKLFGAHPTRRDPPYPRTTYRGPVYRNVGGPYR
jgi:membrane associated rhomboid family serine protease